MNLIPTRVHGVLDYLSGVLFVASPWLFGFADGSAAQWVPVIAGLALLGLSIFTNYEAGLVKSIPMPTHLTVDVLTGIVLAASPWIFGFADRVYLPHVIFGLLEVGAGLLTQKTPSPVSKRPDHAF
ncbi:SPW repeat protein [Larkinella insperata]|uniref:SPW repeat protein n=1 Tax=Larkinella insperata TaxID=332158 RepID=A0ABW3QD37_9BACT